MIKNWINRWRATWHPEMFHGWGKRKRYFEGWYVKVVDPAERAVFAIIPGIAMGADGVSHAFIQVLDGIRARATYHQFDAEEFVPSSERFELELGSNFFSSERIRLDLPELSGELLFEEPFGWPKMLGAPGIMGWYSFAPFMECYHGVLSMNHHINGKLRVYGEEVNFDSGKGYMEKDWGISFPRSWIWTQSNHFDTTSRVSLMASVAHIPWLGNYFIGYIVGFLLGDKLYRFATYTGAMMKASLSTDKVHLSFKDGKNRLEISGRQAPGAALVSPLSGNMTGKVNESMQAVLEVSFYEGDKLIFEGVGRNAGLEIAGNTTELLTKIWRR